MHCNRAELYYTLHINSSIIADPASLERMSQSSVTPLKLKNASTPSFSAHKLKSPYHSAFASHNHDKENRLNTDYKADSHSSMKITWKTSSLHDNESVDSGLERSHCSESGEFNHILPTRVEQLETEKKELQLQVQLREEKEQQLRHRLKQMESQLKSLENKNTTLEKTITLGKDMLAEAQQEKDSLINEVRKLTRQQAAIESNSLWSQITSTSRELLRAEGEIQALKTAHSALQEVHTALQAKSEGFTTQIVELQNELCASNDRNKQLEQQLTEAMKENVQLSARIASMDAEFSDFQQASEHNIFTLQEEIYRLENLIDNGGTAAPKALFQEELEPDSSAELQATIAELRAKLFESEAKRRKLHNTVQDLRGSIRVYVRCRPFLPHDDSDISCVDCSVDQTCISLTDAASRGAGQVFSYDHVFASKTTQRDIFGEVSDLVQSALDGYRVCVFCYGQTGSGKTHTMLGGNSADDRGIIPRSIEHITRQMIEMNSNGWETKATYSMLEVYNETLIDLLQTDASFAEKNKLKITFANDRVSVANLYTIEADTSSTDAALAQLNTILSQAAKSRTTAATAMNERSSRSHVLFFMDVVGLHEDGTALTGGLRLVDLAGSERLDRTGTLNDPARLRESVNINKSLSCLGDVFLALAKKTPHVPFRNSKLTMLLQDCLSGDGKTLMCVNVSPTPASSHETLCSLKFASQVSQVQQGPAKKAVFSIPKNLNPVLSAIITANQPTPATMCSTSMSLPQREPLMREAVPELASCQRIPEHNDHYADSDKIVAHEYTSKYARKSIVPNCESSRLRTTMKRPLTYIPEHTTSSSNTAHQNKKYKPLPPKPSSWR